MSGMSNILLTDATVFINLFQGGGQGALDAFVSSNNVVITDVVAIELTRDLGYTQDQAIQSLIESGGITVATTDIGQQIEDGQVAYQENDGEISMGQYYSDPANSGYNITIASDDSGTLRNNAGNVWENANVPLDSILNTIDITQDMYADGAITNTQYAQLRDSYLNNRVPDADFMDSNAQLGVTQVFAEASGQYQYANATDPLPAGDLPVDSTDVPVIPSGSDPTASVEAAMGGLPASAGSVGATDATLASIEALGGIAAAAGLAGLTYAAFESYETAAAQIEAGNYAGAAQTMTNFGASVAAGLYGAELGGDAGGEIGAAIGGLIGGLPGAAIGTAAGALAGSIAGALAGFTSGPALAQAMAKALGSFLSGVLGALGWAPSIGPTYPGAAGGSFTQAERDPLAVDVAGTGLNLTPEPQGTYYSWFDSDFENQTGWIGTGTGFLVLAPVGGGPITATDFITSFAQLQALDTNDDGVLNSSDPGFANLEIWEDINGAGTAEPGQLFTLAQLGIQSIDLNDQTTDQILAGNTVEAVSSVTMADGTTQEIAAVAFGYSQTYTQYVGPDTPSTAAAALPQLHGYGDLTDLQEAMTSDPTLLGLVQNFVQISPTDSFALGTAIVNIMFEWAGVAGLNPQSWGPLFDIRELGFLQDFLGTSFLDVHGHVYPMYVPELDSLTQAWNTAFDGIAARLLLQGPMANNMADFTFDPSSDLIVCTTNFGQALQDVAANAPTDPTAALQYWWAAVTVLDSYVSDWQAIDTSTGGTVVPATQAAYDAMLTSVAPELTASELTALRAVTFDSNTESGNGGSGLFTYDAGSGELEINENAGAGNATTAILVLGAGISLGQLSVTGDPQGNLYLTDGIAGDQVKLEYMMLPGIEGTDQFGVQTVSLDDGSSLSAQQLIDMADTASGANRNLYGFGAGGTFSYAAGMGQVQIDEDAGWGVSTTATLLLGSGIAESQLGVTSDAAGNLYLSDGTAGDRIELDLMMTLGANGSLEYGVGQVQFANGATLTAQQLIATATTGSPTNTILYGTPGADVFNSEGYATYEQGDGGSDTFVYDAGYGSLEINEWAGSGTASSATLQFGPGIAVAQLGVTADGSGNLYLTDGIAGDLIKLDGVLNESGGAFAYGVASVSFVDGTVLTTQQLIALADTASPTNTRLYGTPGADVLDSKGYATYEQGNGGADSFIYNAGYGPLEINEDAGSGIASTATLDLGSGVSEGQVVVTADGSGDMSLTDGTAGDEIKIDGMMNLGWYSQPEYGVAEVQFADGAVWSRQQLIDLADTGSPQNTKLYGTPAPDTFDSRGYATYEQGNGGNDTFLFNAGYGQLEINEEDHNPSASNVLEFGSGITAAEVQVTGNAAGDILLTVGSNGDQITLDDMLNSSLGSVADGISDGVQSVDFADGTAWSAQQIIGWEETGTATNQNLFATIYSNGTLIAGPGGDTMTGSVEGNTTYNFAKGDGVATINPNGAGGTIVLAAGITESEVLVQADNSGDLMLVLTDDPSDSITVKGDLVDYDYGFSVSGYLTTVTFADGTTWTLGESGYAFTWDGTATDTTLLGSNYGSNVFNLGPGGDTATGGNSQALGSNDRVSITNTYNFAKGDGEATINPNGAGGTIVLAAGITESEVLVQADNSGDLMLVLTDDPSDSITVKGDLVDYDYGFSVSTILNKVTFADGTTWTLGESGYAFTWDGTATDTTLVGSNYGSNVFNLGPGGDTATGGNSQALGSNDRVSITNTYNFTKGDGEATINPNDAGGTIALAAGITESEVLVQADNSGDLMLVLTDDPSDSITVKGDLVDYDYGFSVSTILNKVAFADGTTWTLGQSGYAFTWDGTASDTTLVGSNYGSNVFNLGPGGDTATGGNSRALGSNDRVSITNTYNFAKGDGEATINPNGAGGTIALAAGITESEVLIQADNSGDLMLVLTDDPSDGITVKGDLVAENSGGYVASYLGQVAFADGTVWTLGQSSSSSPPMVFTWDGTASDTTLIGSNYGSNVFNLGPGGDTVTGGNTRNLGFYGGWGTNTYDFAKGDGHATVNLNGQSGTIQMAAAINEGDVAITTDSNHDLIATVVDTGDTILVQAGLSSSSPSTQMTFSDGTTWTHQQLSALATTGTTGSDVITGTFASEVFDGRGGSDTITGDGGSNTYIFREGYGQLTINNATTNGSAAAGQLDFGPGIMEQNLWFSEAGTNLVVNELGSADQVTINGWFGSNPSAALAEIIGADDLKLDLQLPQLVAAMATYAANNPGFNPVTAAQMPSDASLQSAVAAAWHN
jgi:hypothetical protein